ncbi:cell division control protein 48 [Mycena amicta]|nr:cell division control protein 48 [Mycena amicta]
MCLVWRQRISRRPVGSGIPTSTSRLNRPNRRRAGSMELGRFVAAITTTLERALSPSIRVRSWDTTRHDSADLQHTFSRFGAIESISSMKMIAGEFFSASSNAFRRLLSLSPAILLMISGPLMRKKNVPVLLATARVLPAPGGPNIRILRGGLIRMDLNSWG